MSQLCTLLQVHSQHYNAKMFVVSYLYSPYKILSFYNLLPVNLCPEGLDIRVSLTLGSGPCLLYLMVSIGTIVKAVISLGWQNSP